MAKATILSVVNNREHFMVEGEGTAADPYLFAVYSVDAGHYEIHEQQFYEASHKSAISNANTYSYSFVVANNTSITSHLFVGLEVNGDTTMVLTEGSTFSGGSALTAYNHHRGSTKTATAVLKHGVTPSGGTALVTTYLGSGVKSAANARSQDEWVLKNDTTYTVTLTAGANINACIHFYWYEAPGLT